MIRRSSGHSGGVVRVSAKADKIESRPARQALLAINRANQKLQNKVIESNRENPDKLGTDRFRVKRGGELSGENFGLDDSFYVKAPGRNERDSRQQGIGGNYLLALPDDAKNMKAMQAILGGEAEPAEQGVGIIDGPRKPKEGSVNRFNLSGDNRLSLIRTGRQNSDISLKGAHNSSAVVLTDSRTERHTLDVDDQSMFNLFIDNGARRMDVNLGDNARRGGLFLNHDNADTHRATMTVTLPGKKDDWHAEKPGGHLLNPERELTVFSLGSDSGLTFQYAGDEG